MDDDPAGCSHDSSSPIQPRGLLQAWHLPDASAKASCFILAGVILTAFFWTAIQGDIALLHQTQATIRTISQPDHFAHTAPVHVGADLVQLDQFLQGQQAA